MKGIVFRRSSTAAGLVVGLVGLAVALGGLAGGCGEDGAKGPGGPGATAGGGEALPELPPIDLLAPTSFETASFALG